MSDSSEEEIEQNIKSELREINTSDLTEAAKTLTISSYKELAEENEVPELYPKEILKDMKSFDYIQSILFKDTFFSLPTDVSYDCMTYCEAFIHSLNLAACCLVYTSIP